MRVKAMGGEERRYIREMVNEINPAVSARKPLQHAPGKADTLTAQKAAQVGLRRVKRAYRKHHWEM